MSEIPQIVDRTALAAHRRRAARAPEMFLHQIAAEDLEDRLSLVNRTFTAPAVVTPVREFWRARLPGARIVTDAETLDLQPGAHDLVLHVLALHWANDPVGQLIQCRRALRADGLMLAVTFGGRTLTELRAALGQAEIEVSGGLSPRVLPMADIRDLGALLQRAGLALPVADGDVLTATYDNPLHLMRELRAMGETNALTERLRHPTRRQVILRAAEIYAGAHATPEGRVRASFELVTLTGWAPDASQPRPLRPGSAAARLADALNTAERPLKD